jgi:signal transduction histidine kinase
MKHSLGLKIASGFTAALLSLTVVGVISYRNAANLLAYSEWVVQTHRVLENIKSLHVLIADAETSAHGFFLTGEDTNLEPYRAAVEQLPPRVRTLRALIADNPAQGRRLDVLERLFSEKLAVLHGTIEQRRELGPGPFVTNAEKTSMDRIRETIEEMEDEERGLLAERTADAKASGETAITVIVLATALALVLVSLCGLVIRREMQNRQRAEDTQRALAEELKLRSTKLEAANKDLEAFTYSVSHDLRAPLRHIDGFSKLLLEEASAGLSGDARGYLLDIRDSTVEMGRLVDDLLNLARVGRKELAVRSIGLGTLVDEAVIALKKANVGRVIEWKIGELPSVECDPGLVKQVFFNLLSNAVKFTRPRAVAKIDVEATNGNGQPVISVRDNGVGFSMKNAGRLFGVFQRLHRQEDFEGTGAGLAIIQRIVHKHGGEVWAEAELNRGATFFFTLGAPKQALEAISHPREEHHEPVHLVGRG